MSPLCTTQVKMYINYKLMSPLSCTMLSINMHTSQTYILTVILFTFNTTEEKKCVDN